jgi:hypothetical protein
MLYFRYFVIIISVVGFTFVAKGESMDSSAKRIRSIHQIKTNQNKDTPENNIPNKFLFSPDTQPAPHKRESTEQPTNPSDHKDGDSIWIILAGIGTILLALAGIAQYTLSRESNEKQLRAYVFITPSNEPLIGTGVILDAIAKFHIINAGKTPAYNMRYILKTEIRERPLTTILGFSENDEFTAPSSVYMGNPFLVKILMSNEYINNERAIIGHRTKAVYVWGKILYEDTFGKSHETAFRFIIKSVLNSGDGFRANIETLP